MAEISGGSVHFGVTFDVDQAKTQLEEVRGKLANLGKTMQEQDDEIAKLEKQFADLGKQASKAFMSGDDKLSIQLKNQQAEIRKSIVAIKDEQAEVAATSDRYEEQAEVLEKQIAEYEKLASKQTSLRTQMRNVREEMASLELAGEKGSEAYKNLAQKAGQLQDAYADTSRAMRNMASDTFALDAILESVSFGTDSIEVVTGAMGLFGASTEEAAEMQTKLQAAMALANGVRSIQNALQKESNLMLGIGIIQTKAKAKADALATSTTKAATIAQKIFNKVANANPYVLLATAVLTVVGALAAFMLSTNSAAKAQAELNELEAIELDALERSTKLKREASERNIQRLNNELAVEKNKLNNTKKVREIEDKIAAERKRENAQEIKDNQDAVKNLHKYTDELKNANKELDNINKAKAKGKTKVKLEIDGKLKKVDIDKAIEIMQGEVNNLGKKVEVGTRLTVEKEQLEADAKAVAEQRKKDDAERWKSMRKTQLDIKRQERANEIALMKEGYEKEDEMRRNQYAKAIADLQNRLKQEKATLTKAAKESIKIQIAQQRELYKREQQLENDKRQMDHLNFQMELAQRYRALRSKTPEEVENQIKAGYDDKRTKLLLESKSATEERKKQIDQELDILEEEKDKAVRDYQQELRSQAMESAVELVRMRIDATEEGNKELLRLNKELIDAELEQEIEAIRSNVNLTEDQKAERIALVREKAAKAKDALDTDNEVKKYSTIAGYVNDIAAAMDEIASDMDNQLSAGFVRAFKQVAILSNIIADNINTITGEDGKELLKVDWVKAGPSIVASVFNMVLSSIVNSVKEMQEMKAATQEWVNTLELAKYQLEDIYQSAFGEDVYTKSIDAAAKAAEAQAAYEEALRGANEKGTFWSSSKWSAGWYKGSKLGTRKLKSGSLLSEAMPELFNEDGSVNVDNIQAALDVFGDKMDAETREMIQNILDLKDAAKANLDEVSSYIADTFGDMSNVLMDSIVNAVETGADSWGDFEDAGAKAIENLIKQMAYTTFLKPIFDDYQKDLENLAFAKGKFGWSTDEYLEQQMKLMSEYIGRLEGGARSATEWVRGAAEDGTMAGIFSGAMQESMSGSIQSVTEQTASMVAGQMNAIRMGQIDANGIMRSQLQVMSEIKHDTGTYLPYLREIDSKLQGMNYMLRTQTA